MLTLLGVEFQCHPADIDESVFPDESPDDYVRRMAREKAAAVAAIYEREDCVVLAADTTVVVDGDILGKPVSLEDGRSMLSRLSGRSHTVITALCLHTRRDVTLKSVATSVLFVDLDPPVCEAYLATEEPWDKAGGYGIQGLGGAFVKEIRGSYSNVVGLPLAETWQLLAQHDISTALDPPDE